MTYLLAMLASMCAWIYRITPDSYTIIFHSFRMLVSLHLYISFVYQILSLLYHPQPCSGGYVANTAQITTWNESYTYNTCLLTTRLAVASWYNRVSWKYMCPARQYTTYGDSYSSLIMNTLNLHLRNSSVTHRVLQIPNAVPILCHAVTSND